jgi:DNA invertase Pin-like site-specific DNA recombinase
MNASPKQSTEPPLRAALYARLSETYDAAESVPTQLANADKHAERRGWRVVARLKDDGYSAFKEIRRDDFVNLVEMIERDEIDVVIIRDVDRLTRNLPDWDRFEKAAIAHRVILSAYTGGDLDLSTPEGAYYGGMETLRAKRESAVRSVRVREAHDRIARQGKAAGGGRKWFGYTRVFANPEETNRRKRVILREEINQQEATALRDAAERVLAGETVGSIIREWTAQGIKPPRAQKWEETSLVNMLKSPRLAGLREWQGKTYPAQWPAILDMDTHERLVKLFSDPSRRAHVVGRKRHLLSGVARCGKCGGPLYPYGAKDGQRAATYRCVTGPAGKGCGGVSVNEDLLEEYVTGAVLDALESPRVQQAVRTGQDANGPRRAELLEEIRRAQDKRAEARRDWAEDVIDKEDWLDIKQRTEARISNARREYDRLTGAVTVFSDIPPSDMVRDAWEGWNTDRKRAAIKAVMSRVVVNPAVSRRAYGIRDRVLMLEAVRERTEFDWRF